MRNERRRIPRHRHSGFLLFEAPTVSGGFWWPATLVDISERGLALQLPADRPNLSAGVPVYLSLVFRDRIRFDRIPAILVRQQSDVCAVEFARWSDSDRQRLSNVLRELDERRDPRHPDGSVSDRRRHRRNPVRGVRGSFPRKYGIEVLDMSASGLGVESLRAMEVGNKYRIALPASLKTFELRAAVRWCRLVRVERSGDALLSVFRSGMTFGGGNGGNLPAHHQDREGTGGDRRLARRFAIGLVGPATVTMAQSFSVDVLSLSGMLIQSVQPVDSGSLLNLELVAADRTLPVVGRVITTEPIGRGEGWRAGIAFQDLDQRARRALEEVTLSFLA